MNKRERDRLLSGAVPKERFTKYLDAVMAMESEHIRRELERLQGKLVDAQKLTVSTSPIGRILHR